MSDIELTLQKARNNAKGYGELFGAYHTADDFLKTTYAMLYEDAPSGTVGDRDAWVKRQVGYTAAVERKRDAYSEWKTAETYMKLLLAEVEVWRTKQANERFMDRAHT